VALANAGVVSLLTDGPIARPRHVDDNAELSEAGYAELLQQIVDKRMGADLLLARNDVDPKCLAYVGHSYDATVGAFLSGFDKRFKTFVLMAGSLSDELDLKTKEFQEYRQKVGAQRFDAFIAKWAWPDPSKFVSHAAPATAFLQYASRETFLNPEHARACADLVSEPKNFKEYDEPHALNTEARRDRIAFLTEQFASEAAGPQASRFCSGSTSASRAEVGMR